MDKFDKSPCNFSSFLFKKKQTRVDGERAKMGCVGLRGRNVTGLNDFTSG